MSQPAVPNPQPVRISNDAGGAQRSDARVENPALDSTPSPPPPLGRARRRLISALSSYRLRVLIWFIVLLGVGTFATVAVLTEVLLQRTDERVRADLMQEGREFRQLAGGIDPATGAPFGPDVARIFDVFLTRSVPSRNEVFVTFVDGEVYQRTGRRAAFAIETDPTFVARVASAPDSVTGRLATPAGAVDYQAIPVRVDGETRGVFAVAIFRDLERSEQEEVFRAALSVGLILLLIGSFLAWRLADRVLAPVRQTAATARSISETDLSRRVAVRGNDEVAELARTFNEMLDRVGTAFSAQQRFMNDVGHELRTPLTIVQGHLELLDEGSPIERERAVQLMLEEVERMTGLVSDLMLLAASAQPDFIRREPVDAPALARGILDKARVLGDRDWQLDIVRTGTISADRQRLTQAMLQLVANAVRLTGPGDAIHIGADVDASVARFWVRDSGPGIPESEQKAVFQRFYRGAGESRSSGSGLGLSIVKAIAEAHGGTVDVASLPGRGATFTLVVPLDEPGPASPPAVKKRSWFRG
ncbi:MAG: HAMP domain-containing histidine kinase [Chloroflexota bacterium]|nr:HAMP domain-containing histidine kinase [Chloroflexota bacterium]